MSVQKILTTLTLVLVCLATGNVALADPMPDQVSLESLTEFFTGVAFDHAMHTELGEDCSTCHHHTTGTGTSDERCVRCHANSPEVAAVLCRDCHVTEPFSAERINHLALDVYQYHIDKPGLKAAYHWNCVGCHEQMDGPTACLDCHARTPAGEALYRAELSDTQKPAAGH